MRDKLVACFEGKSRLREDAAPNATVYCRALARLLDVLEAPEQSWATTLTDTLLRPLHTLAKHLEPNHATTAKCALAALRIASGSALGDELSGVLQCIHDFLDDEKERFDLSAVTLFSSSARYLLVSDG